MDAKTTRRIKDNIAFEAARTKPPAGFPRLPDIAAARYIDPQFLELEKQGLWKRSWLYAGHNSQVAEPGSWFLTRNTGTPILIVRDLQGKLRAFYNTCRHRGGPLVTEEAGQSRGFVCGYHGWSYTLDGQLKSVRDKRDFVDLDLSKHPLSPVRCERFGNWIFVNEDPDAEPLLTHLGPMPAMLEEIQPEQVRFVHRKSYPVKCNVKPKRWAGAPLPLEHHLH